MAKRFVRRALGLGLLSGAAYAAWRAYEARREVSAMRWEPQPFPFPPAPVRPEAAPAAAEPPVMVAQAAWVAPLEGECPQGYPVKAKLASGIFHGPGGQNYDRTHPDRCYRDAAAAEADGLRAAKR